MQFNDDKIWEPLKTQGSHFCHLKVNSLLSKIDKLRDSTNHIRSAILSIIELKLDSFVINAGVKY